MNETGSGNKLIGNLFLSESPGRRRLAAVLLKTMLGQMAVPDLDFKSICGEYLEMVHREHGVAKGMVSLSCDIESLHMNGVKSLVVFLILDWFIESVLSRHAAGIDLKIEHTTTEDHELVSIRNDSPKKITPEFNEPYHEIAEAIQSLGGRVIPVSSGIDIMFLNTGGALFLNVRKRNVDPRILIVEDQSIIALYLKKVLEGEGYTVTGIVESGEDVLSAVINDKPDLIIMDIFLRDEMTGIDAAKLVTEKFAVPIIYATANVERDIMEKAMKTGPFGYIKKPINRTELISMVHTALAG